MEKVKHDRLLFLAYFDCLRNFSLTSKVIPNPLREKSKKHVMSCGVDSTVPTAEGIPGSCMIGAVVDPS